MNQAFTDVCDGIALMVFIIALCAATLSVWATYMLIFGGWT